MQGQFDFSGASTSDGLAPWRREREERLAAVARALGLPLGHPCRVELQGEVELNGPLRLADEDLTPPVPGRNPDLRLQVGRCIFTPREIVSVVRLD